MLELTNLVLAYGEHTALDRVTLRVGDGELLALLGPSGSGKTSLLRVITGLEKPDEGSVVLDGQDITDLPVHRRRMGLMFQDYALFPHLTVAENVAFGLRMQGTERQAITRRVTEVLSWVELENFSGRPIESLSGGEQQRVALARSLAPEPRLLMLDEPVGALDRALRTRLISDLGILLRRIGVSAIYVTHDQDEAFAIADRVAILHHGQIQQVAPPQELWQAPATRFVAQFLGFENFVNLQARNGQATGPFGAFPISIDDGHHQAVIRPEGIQIDPQGPITGIVEESSFVAGRTRLRVFCHGHWLTVETTQPPPAKGQPIRLAIDPEAVHFLND